MAQTLTLDEQPTETATNNDARVGPVRRSAWHRLHLGALLAHIALSLFFTWPLALNFLPGSNTLVPGVMLEDRAQNLWNLWWVRQALISGTNPFVTDMLWYPTPVSLYYHTLNIFNGLLALPLLSFFSLTITYNIVVLFSFVMAGYGAFLLVHYITGNRWAALVGSVVFAYSAYHIATMRGLLQLISLEWVPFFVLFLLLALVQPAWRTRGEFARWLGRRALPAGVALLLVSLVDWYYTMYALMLAGFLGIYLLASGLAASRGDFSARALWRNAGEPLARLALCVVIYAVLVSPILVPTLRELRQANYMQPAPDAALANSADLLTFFQPTRDQRLWGRFFTNRREWTYGSNRYEVYFTYTALFLTGVALFATRNPRPVALDPGERSAEASSSGAAGRLPGKWFWGASGLAFFLLALGPVLQVNGQQVRGIPMPYALVERLPVLNISRSPDRFDMPLTLCMAVLAGYGTNVLMRTWGRGFGLQRRGALLTVGAIALMAIELAPIPYPQRVAEIPKWYYQLGREPGDFSILDLPPQDDFWHGAFRMYNQTAHGKRIFGGYISREFPHPFLRSTPGYQELTYVDGAGDMFAAGPNEWYSAFKRYDTRYIVLQKDRLPNFPDPPVDISPSRDAIRKVLGEGAAPIYSDEELEVYRVPPPTVRVPFLTVGEGWEPREQAPDGSTYRWMGAEATLQIDSDVARNAFLSFRSASLGSKKPLVIYHGDYKVFEGVIETGVQTFRTTGPLGLPKGVSTLRFVSPEGAATPLELGLSDDPRWLSFVLMDVKLEPVE